jgi:ABC-type lipoprotein export system ATPase subunit
VLWVVVGRLGAFFLKLLLASKQAATNSKHWVTKSSYDWLGKSGKLIFHSSKFAASPFSKVFNLLRNRYFASMIQVRNLNYAYEPGKVIRFPDFTVEKKSSCLLLGESGSGKTTLLHLIGGLLRNQEGSISIEGNDISKLSESELDRFRGKNIGFIFQRNHLIHALNVKQNLLMSPYLSGLKQDEIKVNETLKELGLEHKGSSKITELSQGQAQRVAIGRAVLNNPSLILADEPTSALDDRNCERVIELLLQIAKVHGSTLLIATHDQRLKSKISQQIILSA